MVEAPLENVGTAPQRRLSDLIAQSFFRARDMGDIVTAEHLLAALESLTKRESELYPEDRRFRVDAGAPVAKPMSKGDISLSSVTVVHDPSSLPQVVGQPAAPELAARMCGTNADSHAITTIFTATTASRRRIAASS